MNIVGLFITIAVFFATAIVAFFFADYLSLAGSDLFACGFGFGVLGCMIDLLIHQARTNK